jgi:hypothetical protein
MNYLLICGINNGAVSDSRLHSIEGLSELERIYKEAVVD